MNWYLAALKKYATFSGRARLKEFWMFTLFSFIINLILFTLELICLLNGIVLPLTTIYAFGTLLPGLALWVRRLHDTGRSGSFAFLLLIPLVGAIILLVFAGQRGIKGDNMYGADPLQSPDANLQGQ